MPEYIGALWTLLDIDVVEAGETELLSKPLINIYKYYKALFCVPPVVPKMPAKASVSPFKHLSGTLYRQPHNLSSRPVID